MALTTSQTALCAMIFGATVSGVGTHHVVKKKTVQQQKSVSTASIIAPEPSRTVQTASGGSITIFDSPVLGNCITPDLPEAFEVPELRKPRPPIFNTGVTNGGGGFVEIVSRVPEPDTWTMLIAGFGFVGLSLRRRKEHGFNQTSS